MKSLLIAVIFLIIGGVAGGFLAFGVGAATGIAAGSQVGVCLAMETARSDGLLTAEQIDKVIADTVDTIRSKSAADTVDDIEWISNEKECADMVAKMQAEIAKSSN